MVMERRHQFALYRAMLLARRIDEAEQRLAREGAVFFHIPGAGHEGSCGAGAPSDIERLASLSLWPEGAARGAWRGRTVTSRRSSATMTRRRGVVR